MRTRACSPACRCAQFAAVPPAPSCPHACLPMRLRRARLLPSRRRHPQTRRRRRPPADPPPIAPAEPPPPQASRRPPADCTRRLRPPNCRHRRQGQPTAAAADPAPLRCRSAPRVSASSQIVLAAAGLSRLRPSGTACRSYYSGHMVLLTTSAHKAWQGLSRG